MTNAQTDQTKVRQKDRPWLIRTYAGHSTAAKSNALYRAKPRQRTDGPFGGVRPAHSDRLRQRPCPVAR